MLVYLFVLAVYIYKLIEIKVSRNLYKYYLKVKQRMYHKIQVQQ